MANENKKISVDLVLKKDEFNRNLTETKQAIRQTSLELQQAGQQLNTYGSNIHSLTSKQKLLETQIVNVNDKMKLYQENIIKNTTKMEANKKVLEELGNKKKDLNSQYKEAIRVYGEESDEALRLKEALEQCKSEYIETENKIKSNNKAISSNTSEITKCETELVKLQGELSSTKKAIEENSNGFLHASKKFEEAGNKLENLGGKISDTGGNLMKLSAPMVALSGASAKVAMDFESAMSEVKAISGATADDLKLLEDKAKEMGKTTSKSAKDSAEALKFMSLAGWGTKEMLEGLEPILRLSEASGADLATTSDLVTDSMSAMGIETKNLGRYLDVVAKTQNSANTSANDMLQAYIGVGGTFKNLNVPLEESATWLGVLANRGIKGSEAGNALNSTLINLTSGAGQAGTAMEQLGISAFDTDGNFIGIENTLKLLNTALVDCTEEQKQTYLAMIGGKTNIDTLQALLSGLDEEYSTLKGSVTDSNGALEKMAKTMQDNTKGEVTKLKSQLEALGIQLGDKLLPHVNSLIGEISKLVEWFGNLDDGTQEMILNMGLMTFVTGGLLKGVGGVTNAIGGMSKGISGALGWLGKMSTATAGATTASVGLTSGVGTLGTGLSVLSGIAAPVVAGIGAIAGGIYLANEAQDVWNGNMLKSAESMSSTERIIASFAGVTVYTADELDKLGLKFKDLEGVDEPTKETMDNIIRKSQDLQFAIDQIEFDGIITDEEIVSVNSKTEQYCQTIIDTIISNKQPTNEALLGLFEIDGLDEREKLILDAMQGLCDEEVSIVKEKQAIIQEVNTKGNNATVEDIKRRDEAIKALDKIALDNLSISHEQREQLQSDFLRQCEGMDADSMQKRLVQEKQGIEESKEALRVKYEDSITKLQDNSKVLTGEAKKANDELLAVYQEEYRIQLENEDRKWLDMIGVVEEKYPQYMATINKYDGEILTNQDIKTQKELENMVSKYEGINQITESGMYRVYDKNKKAWDDIFVTVDSSTGDVVALHSNLSNKTAGYTDDMRKSLAKTAMQYNLDSVNIKSSLRDMSTATVNSSGEIIDSNGNVIGSINDLERDIKRLSGQNIKVNVDKNGSISNINDIINKINAIPTYKKTTVETVYTTKGGNTHSAYEMGGTVNETGLSQVNESGVELIDSISGSAYSVSNAIKGELAYTPSNTKVTNALMTTAKMNNQIEREVSRQLKVEMNTKIEEAFEKLSKNFNGNSNITFENTFNVTNNTPYDVKRFEVNVEKDMIKQLTKRGMKIV